MTHDSIQIQVPRSVLVAAFLEKMARASGPAPQPASTFLDTPAIGAPYLGGIYAGPTIDIGPMALILLPGEYTGTWDGARAWAAQQGEGAVLPSRIDALVLFKNLKPQFQEAYYWTDEPVAHSVAFAWFQSFGNGYQDSIRKGNGYRARAVRRVAI